MDADLFGKLREWFSLMADMEVKASCSSLESYQRLHSQAGMVSCLYCTVICLCDREKERACMCSCFCNQ